MTVSVDFDNIKTLNQIQCTEFVFDPSNPNWHPEFRYNAFFINQIINVMQDKLQVRGVLFLNEVLDQLGMKRIPEGQLYGWTMESINSLKTALIGDIVRHNDDDSIVLIFAPQTFAIKAL